MSKTTQRAALEKCIHRCQWRLQQHQEKGRTSAAQHELEIIEGLRELQALIDKT